MIKKLRLRNFKNFKDAELPLGPFTVLIGENASGKSNLRDAFRFLHGISMEYSLADIFGEKRVGGSLQWQGIRGGTQEISFQGHRTFEIETDFERGEEDKNRVISYSIEVEPGKPGIRPRVVKENLRTDGTILFQTRPLEDDLLKKNSDVRVEIHGENKPNYFKTAEPILGQVSNYMRMPDDVGWVGELCNEAQFSLRNIRFFEFIPDAMRKPSFPGQVILEDQGDNLSSVLQAIFDDEARKRAVIEWLRELTPMDAVDFEFISDQTGKILVNLIEANGQKISAYSASDGTLRFLGLLAAIFGPEVHLHHLTLITYPNPYAKFLFIEELENGIHPSRLHLLVQLIEQQTREKGIQVVATTHSPQLLRLLSQDSLADAALLYRLPGSPEAHIKQFRDLPEESQQVLKEQDVASLHESGWFEDIMDFIEGEPVA